MPRAKVLGNNIFGNFQGGICVIIPALKYMLSELNTHVVAVGGLHFAGAIS